MLVNAASIRAIFVNLKTVFQKSFDGAPSDYLDTCMEVPSTGSENDYDWLDRFPKMREWVGDKVIRGLKAWSYTLKNKPFEATIQVKRDNIEDDQIGIYATMTQDAGFSAKVWPDELMTALKDSAFTSLCYDGQ